MPSDAAADQAFERLYRQHLPAVLAYAARRSDPVTAPDVAAETFLIAWRRMSDIPDDPLPWLLVVAKNVMLNQRRGAARQSALADRLIDEERRRDLVSDAVGDDPDLIVALNRIPADDRELLCLEAWDGLSRQQLAAAAGCSLATLRVRLFRARRRLSAELASLRSPGGSPTGSEVPE
jgi:RNA polymerase sigma factor (sigma-70 family)